MPRKPKVEKRRITVVVNGEPIAVTLHPPRGNRVSWFAYWSGLVSSKSTGQADFAEAVKAVESMLRNGGTKAALSDTILSDEEFEEIQRRHYAKKTCPEAQRRSAKSLKECLDAISAFRAISGLKPVTLATADDCERFQVQALKTPKNWRLRYADNSRSIRRREQKGKAGLLSPNTVLKWLVALQAAFERANCNAGKKCVRGVVPESKLLTHNPWRNFTWIEGSEKPLRQFDHSELLSLLDHFGSNWPGLAFAPAFVKVSLWSWARRLEISSLCWSNERKFGSETHFESKGKWAVTKWFRIPPALRNELWALRNPDSDYVFARYPEQLRAFYLGRGDNSSARRIRLDFSPENLGEWIYHQIRTWSQSLPRGAAYLHVFRKSGLQHAFSGEHIEQRVAEDAAVTPGVMMASYVRASDEELRQRSNRTFRRILSSLPVDVASRYGFEATQVDRLKERIGIAHSLGDWEEVKHLADELSKLERRAG